MSRRTTFRALAIVLLIGCPSSKTDTDSDTDADSDTDSDTDTEVTGCAAVPVCDGDPNCHFLVGQVDGLNVSCSNESGQWILRVQATGLPEHAYRSDMISAQNYDLELPLEPDINPEGEDTSCPDFGGPDVSAMQGILINGVSIHRALTPQLQDPVNPPEGVEAQPVDPCDGHTTVDEQYHVHTLPKCLYGSFFNGEQTFGADAAVNQTSWDLDLWPAPSGVIGYTLRGFPIYGPYADSAKNPHDGLDACGGKLSADGSRYAYYVQDTYPYMIGCVGPGRAISETVAEDWDCTGAPPDLE